MELNIRLATIADLPSIIAIYNQAIRAGNATADLTELTTDERLDWFHEHDKDRYPLYVLGIDGKTVGWGSLSVYRKGRLGLRETAEISYYIEYGYQGRGLGQALIHHMLSDCHRLGIKNVIAILLDINHASINILEKVGFQKWGHLPNVVSLLHSRCGHLIYGKNLE